MTTNLLMWFTSERELRTRNVGVLFSDYLHCKLNLIVTVD